MLLEIFPIRVTVPGGVGGELLDEMQNQKTTTSAGVFNKKTELEQLHEKGIDLSCIEEIHL